MCDVYELIESLAGTHPLNDPSNQQDYFTDATFNSESLQQNFIPTAFSVLIAPSMLTTALPATLTEPSPILNSEGCKSVENNK